METNKLLQASIAESTWHTYKSACASFNQFRYLFRLSSTWPAPLDQVVHFIAYMSMQGRAPGFIRTYISGFSYMYKIHGLEDVTKSFIVTKMLEGAARQTQKRDTRAPISLQRIHVILQALEKVTRLSFQVGFLLSIFRFPAGR